MTDLGRAMALSAAEVVRSARLSAGLTQAQLAQRAGVTQSVISAYESGRREPALSTLSRLVGAAGLRLEVQIGRPLGEGYPS
ncbi:MAG: helix-turn-helix transcriptional regulator, partial [Actinomycetes bacterium]